MKLRDRRGLPYAEVDDSTTTPIEIEGFALVLHPTPEHGQRPNDQWTVSEPKTGRWVGFGKTRGEAVRDAQAKIIYERTKNNRTVATMIEEHTKKL